MARISGVDLPREKRVEIGLTYIYGIGVASSKRILAEANVDPDIRCKDLTDEDVSKIRDVIDRTLVSYTHLVNKHRRIRSRLSGTPEQPRLAVFRSNNHMYAQIIDDVAGNTIVSASTVQADVKEGLTLSLIHI